MSQGDGPVLRAALARLATLEQLFSDVYGLYADLGMGVVALEAQLRDRTDPLDAAALHAQVEQLEQIITQARTERLSERITAYYQGQAQGDPAPYQQVRVALAMLDAVHRSMQEQIAWRRAGERGRAVAEAVDQVWADVLAAHEAALERALVALPEVSRQIAELAPPTITPSA